MYSVYLTVPSMLCVCACVHTHIHCLSQERLSIIQIINYLKIAGKYYLKMAGEYEMRYFGN